MVELRIAVKENKDLIVPIEHELNSFLLGNRLDDFYDLLLDGTQEGIGGDGELALVSEFFLPVLDSLLLERDQFFTLTAFLLVLQKRFLLLEVVVLQLEFL